MKNQLAATITMLLLAVGQISAATLYVDSKSSNPTPPYSSWATAANNVQDAVNAAPSGALVFVNDGVYSGGVVVGAPLILMSVNGAQSTFIDGGGTNRCLNLTNNTWVWGFTFTNGYADKGAGVLGTETNCFLTNCVVTGNSANNGGGSYSGTFYNCLFTGNAVRGNGLGGAAFNSTLYNCTVSGNSAAEAGGVFQSTLYNSIVYDNTAPTNANYSSSTFNYCCTTPLPAGSGNIPNAPLFVNEANGNFRLQSGSPCIDAGNNSYNGANGLTDLDGNPRFWGTAVDMGAYEYEPDSAPVITSQPANQTVYAGSTVGFSVGVSGSQPLFWQWQFGKTPINGATDSTLTLTAVTANQAGSYSVVVTNGFGTVTSQVAVLNVMDGKPLITVQPMTQTVYTGSNVVLSAAASGSLPLSWQWQFNGAAIVGATNSTLTLASITTNQGGGYSVVVTNTLGSVTSQVAVLTVLVGPPPSITLQPTNQTAAVGGSVSFVATASGLPPLFWQWLFNGNPIQDATNSTLPLTAITASQAGSYSVIVSNVAGTATSSNATLIVPAPGTKYVWQNSPNPTPPYTSWPTAAHSIPDAVNAAFAADLILVTNGVYSGGLSVGKAVTVQSVNGPLFTIINGGGTNQCAALDKGASLSGLTLTNGTSYYNFGGGVWGLSPTVFLTNCVIAGNSDGGAAWCTLYNCTLTGNSAYEGGGAMRCTLYNCQLAGNFAGNGGGADSCTLYNCTLTGNSASGSGGGANGCVLYNCITYFNTAGIGANYDMSSTLNYCCTTPLPPGGGHNITLDPQLTDSGHISAASPCRGAGAGIYSLGTDLDGEPWNNPPSIGCDEYYSGPVSGPLTATLLPDYTNVTVGFSVNFAAFIEGRAALNVWDFGDGTVVSNRLYPSHAWALPGDYVVAFSAFNDSNPGGVRSTVIMHVAAQALFYVAATSANPQLPYASWDTAARGIQDAVNAALPGALVLVTNGVYTGGIVVNKSVALRSVNGAASTAIIGLANAPCVSLTNNSSLCGFTITNGGITGVSCSGPTDFLTNCVIAGNNRGASLGTLYNCTLIGNGNSGAVGCTLYNCALTGNNADIGGGAYNCVLYDCSLTGNSAGTNGSAAIYSTLYNCTLTGNSLTESWQGGAAAFSCNLHNCALTRNVCSGATDCNLYNCALTGNSGAGAGGGALYNCTLTGNSGGGALGGALYNCIAYYNPASGTPLNYISSTLNYCCTTPMPTNGAGNITNEPALATDWRLSSTSPCLGAGSAAYAQGLDLDGEPWRNPPAIGCDEYYTGSFTGALAVASTAAWMTFPTGFAAAFDGTVMGRASDSRWEFGDGTVESNRLHTSHRWLAAGDYNVVLRAYSSDSPAGITATLTIRVVAQAPVYYVDANSPSPAPPYTSWGTAARNIQDAIAAAWVPESLVLVTNGTYPGGVIVTNPLTLASVNGPIFTVIDGGGTNRFVSLNTNANLSGFMITNGAAGGVSCGSAAAHLTNCIIAGNFGSGTYGGTLYNCVLSNNSNYFSGSGASSATLYNCTISGNLASLNGSGAWDCTLYNCQVTGNAGFFAATVGCRLYNCALTGNSGDAADGCTLYNCTLTANGSRGTSGSKLYNCVVYYNHGPGRPNYDNTCILNYCCTTPMPTNGVGNITNEPALASSWRLSVDSPCRRMGSGKYASGVDLDGEPWFNPPSIGCDEFYSETVTGALNMVILAAWTNMAPDFNVALEGKIFGNASATRWEFGDGTIESNRLYTSHEWQSPGDYEVVLRAYNNDHPAGVTTGILVRVVATPTYYVDIRSTQPSVPYSSWDTAATNIQDAVSMALVPGSLVLVSDGVYQFGGQAVSGLLTNRVAVQIPITVRSLNGPDATVIKGDHVPATTNGDTAVRCVYLCDGAVLSGFTLTNGATRAVYEYDVGNGGGVFCQSNEATITNCTITGNAAFLLGGGAAGGNLKNCTLAGNVSLSDGAGSYGANLENCLLTGNTSFSTGGGAAGCTLADCTLKGNNATYGGGGAEYSTLDHCRIIGNMSQGGGGVGWLCTVNNSLLANNSATGYGGGGAAAATLYNCTLVDNSSSIPGYGGGTTNCTLYNCIAYYNSGENCSGSILNYCCTYPMPTNGFGNIMEAPLFVDQTKGDFHLQSNSPCINAGNNALVSGTTDLDRNPRIVGTTVDMGAYEFQRPGSAISYAWLQQWGLPTDGSADYADTDGDGMNNWQEWVCGTCPTNAQSVLRLLSVTATSNNVTLTWQSVPGVNYFLQRSADLGSPFALEATNIVGLTTNIVLISSNSIVIGTNIIGQASATIYTDTNSGGTGQFFYRVGVNRP